MLHYQTKPVIIDWLYFTKLVQIISWTENCFSVLLFVGGRSRCQLSLSDGGVMAAVPEVDKKNVILQNRGEIHLGLVHWHWHHGTMALVFLTPRGANMY